MRIELLQSVASDGDRVTFKASGIKGTARWRGDYPLESGVELSAELDVRPAVDWAEIRVSTRSGNSTLPDNDVTIKGTVHDLDEQGLLTLRCGDGMLLLETVGDPPLNIVGREVRLAVNDVELYPSEY